MKVQNMTSQKIGREVPNQFVIETVENGLKTEYFQSYGSIIVKRNYGNGVWITWLDKIYWNYSVTTSKYRNQFLGETTKETQAKIDSGEYILADLN